MIEIKNKKGFTLAEVLITLVIIGVIAAMTIPTLIASYRRQQVVSQLKKSYTTIVQALNLAVAEHGFYDGWDTGTGTKIQQSTALATKYLFPYLQTIKQCIPSSEECFVTTINRDNTSSLTVSTDFVGAILSDGSSIALRTQDGYTVLYIDTNGAKGPNMSGYDIFLFLLLTPGTYTDNSNNMLNKDWGLNTAPADKTMTVSTARLSCIAYGECSAYIIKKNWQIDDDYPKKIK